MTQETWVQSQVVSYQRLKKYGTWSALLNIQHYRVERKIVILKKTTLQLYFKTFIEKINSGNLIM